MVLGGCSFLRARFFCIGHSVALFARERERESERIESVCVCDREAGDSNPEKGVGAYVP